MPLMTTRDRQAYRADDHKDHTLLDERERQRMLKVGKVMQWWYAHQLIHC